MQVNGVESAGNGASSSSSTLDKTSCDCVACLRVEVGSCGLKMRGAVSQGTRHHLQACFEQALELATCAEAKLLRHGTQLSCSYPYCLLRPMPLRVVDSVFVFGYHQHITKTAHVSADGPDFLGAPRFSHLCRADWQVRLLSIQYKRSLGDPERLSSTLLPRLATEGRCTCTQAAPPSCQVKIRTTYCSACEACYRRVSHLRRSILPNKSSTNTW